MDGVSDSNGWVMVSGRSGSAYGMNRPRCGVMKYTVGLLRVVSGAPGQSRRKPDRYLPLAPSDLSGPVVGLTFSAVLLPLPWWPVLPEPIGPSFFGMCPSPYCSTCRTSAFGNQPCAVSGCGVRTTPSFELCRIRGIGVTPDGCDVITLVGLWPPPSGAATPSLNAMRPPTGPGRR